jgi:hypothetical protein
MKAMLEPSIVAINTHFSQLVFNGEVGKGCVAILSQDVSLLKPTSWIALPRCARNQNGFAFLAKTSQSQSRVKTSRHPLKP